MLPALIGEAMKKSALIWLSYAGRQARPAWHAWGEDVAYVVSGGPEQALPGLAESGRVLVTARAKETRARLITWEAETDKLIPWTDEWHAAVGLLKPARLNAATSGALAEVWAAESTITKLTPTGEVTDQPGHYSPDSLAAPPAGSPATTRGAGPWVVHRRPRRSPSL